jgi:hypothetical protein
MSELFCCIFRRFKPSANSPEPVRDIFETGCIFQKIPELRRIADLDRITFNSAFNDLFCLEASHLAGGSGLSFDRLATDKPPHGGIRAERRIHGRVLGFLNWQSSDIGGIMIPLHLPARGYHSRWPRNL